jgi:hypothetical protein
LPDAAGADVVLAAAAARASTATGVGWGMAFVRPAARAAVRRMFDSILASR